LAEIPASDKLPEPAPLAGSGDYERWLGEQMRPEDGYLFSEPRVRFEPRATDAVVAAPGLTAEIAPGGVALRPWQRPAILVSGVDAAAVARFLGLLDGERTLEAAGRAAHLDAPEQKRLLRAAFGVVLFAPAAVAALEAEVSCAELVRFPGAPYELDRNYWSNMVDVRRATPALHACLAEPVAALGELVKLHGLALMGAGGRSYYRPASPIAAKGVHPGRLWHAETRLAEDRGVVRFLSGPRVNATLLGGEHYAALLAECSGDPEALAERRDHDDARGLAWGRIVTAQAEHDPAPAPWFCPPRPLRRAHFISLFQCLERAIAAARKRELAPAVQALADFHQKFVRLHPFRAANQSLAMNLVNGVLAPVAGAGIPHLILDQLALRFSEAAYRRLFTLAVRGYVVTGSALERHRKLVEKKARSFALIETLKSAKYLDQARLNSMSHPEDARLALIDA
jgi:hypothetical protein